MIATAAGPMYKFAPISVSLLSSAPHLIHFQLNNYLVSQPSLRASASRSYFGAASLGVVPESSNIRVYASITSMIPP